MLDGTSDACIGDQCQENAQVIGKECDEDSDCENTACGLELFDDSSQLLCCPSGGVVFYRFGNRFINVYTGQSNGLQCGRDEMCTSGLCLGGICSS